MIGAVCADYDSPLDIRSSFVYETTPFTLVSERVVLTNPPEPAMDPKSPLAVAG